jgi:carboxypeptidase C (cathepsin A)
MKLAVPALAFVMLASVAASAWAAPYAERKPLVAVTKHTGEFDGKAVAYTATVQENFMAGADGKPNAELVTIAYVRDGVADKSRRPVVFAYNGGPGASSSPLHLNAIGPVVRDGEAIRNNPYSLLDVADLVFIDPVGAGFSRTFTNAAGKQYWSRTGDANAAADVIARWLKANGREGSPRFLVGESYGTVRTAYMLKDHQKALHFNGFVQVATVARAPGGRDGAYLADFPTMAATAWYWKKVPQTKTVQQTFEDAARFAGSDLTAAYAKGAALTDAEKQAIAQKMSGMIGVPADLIASKNLRLAKDDYMFNIIADQGKRTGQLDTRVTSPLAGATRGAAGDPTMFGPGGLKMDGSGVIGIDEPNAPIEADKAPTALERYFRTDLGFNTPIKSYRGVNFDANRVWDNEGNGDISPMVAQAMKDDPKLKLTWTGGYYDLSTPAYAARTGMALAGVPADRTKEILLPGPHSVFEEDANKAVLSKALRQFIVAASAR